MKTSNVHYNDYREHEALQELLLAANALLDDEHRRMEDGIYISQFTINIAGKSIAFYAGPAQIEGILAFIDHMAKENLYEVHFDTGVVIGIL